MAVKRKKDLYERPDPRQDFIFPRVLRKSPTYKDCWNLKFGFKRRENWLWYEGERWMAHRLSYHLNVRKITCKAESNKWNFVRHTCGHIWCVNPRHLYYVPKPLHEKKPKEKPFIDNRSLYSGRKPKYKKLTGPRLTKNLGSSYSASMRWVKYWGA